VSERVGRYQLEDVIGVGSFATVHRAVDESLESTVVVKVLAENHSLNPEIRERFIAEGRSLRRVDSPHVVVVHDIGETARQQPYLVLAHADRGTLAQRVATLREQGWTASRDDVLALARALAAALSAVHAANLVHRDLSPSNVLLTTVAGLERGDAVADDGAAGLLRTDERLVLADLGLCKDLALNSGLTVAGGTSGFRPPEQRGAGTVDARADLWALSALLRWLTEGAQLPRRLQTVLARSLADDPARRHQDAAGWLADIERALDPEPVAEPPSRRRPLLVATVVVLALVVGLLTGMLLARGQQPSATSGTSSVAIEGPTEVAVGEEAVFSAAVAGVSTWLWTLPTGEYVVDAEQVSVTPTGTGTARLVLTAIADDGEELQVVHVFTVTG